MKNLTLDKKKSNSFTFMRTLQDCPSFSHFTQNRAAFVTDKWTLATTALYCILSYFPQCITYPGSELDKMASKITFQFQE